MAIKQFMVMLGAICCTSCATYTLMKSDRYYQQADIPADAMPQPGQCRLWYNNRPVSEQPPARDCADFLDKIPKEARLIRG
ncbi:hypothetical protein Q7C_2050 [Methylophaga frappieri]|uniref:Uncharacterized protein n=1 Tax=Methylophaga frappieri (strain ATCC BAA-2434 / DSM 25690 / JAM7) TaxID=754477 RepID=I1YJU6_METFJ|nr:hypothetical protein [Methylophaga frappieri]AFJ03189.1 hypothetical protein Q7C_2050 [Methylophaga frappieri]